MRQLAESRLFDHGWFRVWIGLGIGLALLLLVHSMSEYRDLARKTLVESLRRDMAAQAVALEHQLQRSAARDAAHARLTLDQFRQAANARIAWLQVRDGSGAQFAASGPAREPVFSLEQVRDNMRARRPAHRIVVAADGRETVVEAFPIRLAAPAAPASPRRFHVLEIAAPLDGATASLGPLQRSLVIDVCAALALLVALTVLGVRFRSYVEGRQLEAQVEIARRVQQALLPAAAETPGFDLAADCLPAAGVGGDFYDSFQAGDTTAFVLGDVSGKGVPAALLMGVLHGAVRSSAWTDSRWHHEEATRQINRLLCERASRERFASMFWAYFDPSMQLLRYVNAGHFPPLLFKTGQPSPVRLGDGGPVLGLLPNARFDQGAAALDPGDLLVLYSDGISEATSAAGEQFGEERLTAAVRAAIHLPARQVRDRILAAVEGFTGKAPRDDDRTLLVVRYSGAHPQLRPRNEALAGAVAA